MRNRAKCKLCGDIIESMHPTDYVTCKCGEIAVDGGLALRAMALNWQNFLRVNDDGTEMSVKYEDLTQSQNVDNKLENVPHKLTKEQIIFSIDQLLSTIEGLPQNAMTAPTTHYDLLSVLLLLKAICLLDCKAES